MYQKLKSILTENIFLKLFSIIASICLWIVVMNINNPIEIKTFSFNINFINEDILTQNNIAILNLDELLNQKIDVKISGTRPTLLEIANLLDQNMANFTVDLAPLAAYTIDPDTSYIPVNLTPNIPNIPYPNNAYEVVSYSPANIGVVADNIIAVPRKITVEILNEVPNNYVYFTPSISSSNIQVVGPKSVINSIYKIVAPIDIKDQTSTISMNIEPIAYDENGKVVEGLTFNLSTVLVEVPISKQSSVSINTPNIIGSVADGYLIKDVIVSPKFIEVTGTNANISSLGSINLQSIDVSGLSQTKTFTQDVSYLLEQNKLTSKNSTNKVSITIQLESIATRTINLEQINIDILGNLETTNVKILSEDIFFVIQGQKEFLDMITLDSLNPFINITGFGNGESLIPLNITLPTGITLVEKPLILVELNLLDDTNLGEFDLINDDDINDLDDNLLLDEEYIITTNNLDLIINTTEETTISNTTTTEEISTENTSIVLEDETETTTNSTTTNSTTTNSTTTTEETTQQEDSTQEDSTQEDITNTQDASTSDITESYSQEDQNTTITRDITTTTTTASNNNIINQETITSIMQNIPDEVVSLDEIMNEIINSGNNLDQDSNNLDLDTNSNIINPNN